MKEINFAKIGFQLIVVCVLLLNISCRSTQALFQEDTKNWEFSGEANWKFVDNELIGIANDGKGFAITQVAYDDFVLELEFMPDSTINSGIFIRCRAKEMNPTDCYEVNIWDLHPNQDYRTGSIVTKSKPSAIVNTNYKWNAYKIRAEEDRIQVWVNGVLTADLNDNTLKDGIIGLQASGNGEIRFRNVRIKPLKIK